jgi:hypothetical protein
MEKDLFLLVLIRKADPPPRAFRQLFGNFSGTIGPATVPDQASTLVFLALGAGGLLAKAGSGLTSPSEAIGDAKFRRR